VARDTSVLTTLPAALASLLDRLASAPAVDEARSALVDEAVAVSSRPGFETLLCRGSLAFEPFDYQVQTAQTVLRRMRARAILADEVGLGKTIEAGLILAELRMRGLADRVLVVTPAGLVDQWREELERKFGLPTVDPTEADGDDGRSGPRPVVLASLAAARREPLKSRLAGHRWDLAIADEAHRLRNPRSASGLFARALRTRYLLLLTATPVENRLQDLYELISLVAPGLLGTPAQFRQRHGADGPAKPRDLAGLRARTREVMIRHRRSEVALRLPQRLAETVLVEPNGDEIEFYRDLTFRLRAQARHASPRQRLTLRSIARLAGSSPVAVAPTLHKVGWADLGDRAGDLTGFRKADVLLQRVRRHTEAGEKVLVFTAFRQTLDALTQRLADDGIAAAVYHGSLSRAEKQRAIGEFTESVNVLLSTESAGEGRNLQFCHNMINVDLPWNPMQIEQRLGRLHRVGQKHDVLLTNLVSRGTIEQRILHVLESKINLFELVVGELDMILGRIDDDFDLESSIFDAFVTATDDHEFDQRLEELGSGLARARTEYLEGRHAVDALVGDAEGGTA
jgi:SNF2 family DNA or RNA helicase